MNYAISGPDDLLAGVSVTAFQVGELVWANQNAATLPIDLSALDGARMYAEFCGDFEGAAWLLYLADTLDASMRYLRIAA